MYSKKQTGGDSKLEHFMLFIFHCQDLGEGFVTVLRLQSRSLGHPVKTPPISPTAFVSFTVDAV